MKNLTINRICSIAVLLALMSHSVFAQDKRAEREREALRRAQQQAQQMQKEKADLEGKLASIEQEKTTLGAERSKLSAQVGTAQKRLKEETLKTEQLQKALDVLTAEKTTLTAQLQESTQRTTELGGKLAVSDRDLRQALSEKRQLQMVVAQRDKTLASYLESNRQLYQAGRKVIDQCKDQSAASTLLRLEPFTGLHLVEVETRLEKQRDALDSFKIVPEEQ